MIVTRQQQWHYFSAAYTSILNLYTKNNRCTNWATAANYHISFPKYLLGVFVCVCVSLDKWERDVWSLSPWITGLTDRLASRPLSDMSWWDYTRRGVCLSCTPSSHPTLHHSFVRWVEETLGRTLFLFWKVGVTMRVFSLKIAGVEKKYILRADLYSIWVGQEITQHFWNYFGRFYKLFNRQSSIIYVANISILFIFIIKMNLISVKVAQFVRNEQQTASFNLIKTVASLSIII